MPLIVFEGIDGCGKSTQMRLFADRMRKRNIAYCTWREPGSTRLGEAMRRMLLDRETHACPQAELFGYLMARAQLVHERLAPALLADEWVVLDRFYHSTLAYQCFGLGIDRHLVRPAIDLALDGIVPDRVFWLDVSVDEARRRRADTQADRIEARGDDYLQAVRSGYAQLHSDGELVRLDGEQDPEHIAEEIWSDVCRQLLDR